MWRNELIKERVEDEASDGLRWKSVKLTRSTQRTAGVEEKRARRHGAGQQRDVSQCQRLWRGPRLMAERARKADQISCTHGLNLQCSKPTWIEDLLSGRLWLQSIGC